MLRRKLVLLVGVIVLAIAVTADNSAKSQKTTPKRSLLERLQFWKAPPPLETEEKEIPAWSEFAKKQHDVVDDFGVDDYSTGGTIDTEPLTEKDLRPPMPKDPPPKVPDEIDVTEGSESVRSDLTMEDESEVVLDGKRMDDDEAFHDARQDDEQDEFHDAQQQEL